MKENIPQIQTYANVTLLAVFILLFFGVAFLSVYILTIGTMLIVVYVMLQIKIESIRQFNEIKKLFGEKYGKKSR